MYVCNSIYITCTHYYYYYLERIIMLLEGTALLLVMNIFQGSILTCERSIIGFSLSVCVGVRYYCECLSFYNASFFYHLKLSRIFSVNLGTICVDVMTMFVPASGTVIIVTVGEAVRRLIEFPE